MSGVPSNKEALLHRIYNQRRIAYLLIEQSRHLLKPGIPFSSELAKVFKKQGNFGSKDRKLYRELIFTYVRYRNWLNEFASDQDALMEAVIVLASPTSEVQSLYPSLSDKRFANAEERYRHRLLSFEDSQLVELLPDWFLSHVNRHLSDQEVHSLLQRPPLWLRAQKGDTSTLLNQCQAAQRKGEYDCQLHADIPDAIHCPPDLALANIPAYADGALEVQDISSQLILQLVPTEIKGKWLDACAGAGGKTLQLAKMLGPNGQVTAFDTRPAALRELGERNKRARFPNISITTSRPDNSLFDGVLVDAPCSGSGTWRRHPFLKDQTSENTVMEFSERQLAILKQYAGNVAIGGTLVYATCSLSRYENEHVVDSFLKSNKSGFEHIQAKTAFGLRDSGFGITIYPHDFNGDGLFVATMRRIK
ncbi:RsmB/NOP family class I SAM-dependent RNA methyltransferase [Puniceicoccaceae bacterium K14]|nr:RsmB/NOP family class I SAM-dependent RNA methyltransferase [Puniceicoccaceae bacterium K14]